MSCDVVLRALHLCSGYGGFELALRGTAVTVAHVERDAYAAAVLVARMEEQNLAQAPIWDDLETFDGASWRGRVDLITAGFPCQPFSSAGQKRGTDDDRWLWPEIFRIVREVGPRYLFLENVPQLVRHGLPHILADLTQDGFDAEWGLYTAAAVGATHKRQRFWLVAYAPRCFTQQGIKAGDGGADAGGGGVHYEQPGQRVSLRSPVARTTAQGGRTDVADTASVNERESHHQERADTRQISRSDTSGHRFPPRPDDTDGWTQWQGAQPAICREPDGATRWLADALHLGGNGLVPQCAAEAWRQLTERLR